MGFYNRVFEMFLFLMILIDCVMLVLSAIQAVPIDFSYFISYFDLFTCILIFADFLYRYNLADNKKEFIKHNWLDLIAAIPIDFFLLRVFRLFKFVKLIKLVKVGKVLVLIRKDLKSFYQFIKRTYLSKIVLLIIVIVLSSVLFIYFMEPGTSLVDSFWFVTTTITTVGYGDVIPSTQEGKILAMILVIVGFLSLSVLTGSISAAYSNKIIIKQEEDSLKEEIKNLNEKIDKLTVIVETLENKDKGGK